ncbi:MAG TPA: response regulator [Alphaproteobacteria bacterium]|nr:response regulator [Micavibrio sp.]MBK9562884.1 response regulator [Micavibrio sp.]HQX27229.1 response regulator [Alphaproteobacteria bacterium]
MGQSIHQTQVLVVEDHPIMRKALSKLFHEHGFPQVDAVENFDKAVKRMAKGDVGLLVTDTRLPFGMTGIQLTETVRSDDSLPSQPVIIGISSDKSPGLASAYEHARADLFLPKDQALDLPEVAEKLLIQRFKNPPASHSPS